MTMVDVAGRRGFIVLCVCVCLVSTFSLLAETPKPEIKAEAKKEEATKTFVVERLGSNRFSSPVVAWALGAPDYVVVASRNGYVRQWSISQQKMLWEIQIDPYSPVQHMAFVGKDEIAAIQATGQVYVWRAADGVEVRRFQVKPDEGSRVMFAQNIVVTSTDTQSNIWSLADGTLMHTYKRALGQPNEPIAFSPDGSLVAWIERAQSPNGEDADTEDYTINTYLAPVNDLKKLTKLKEQTISSFMLEYSTDAYASLLLFSPDGKTLAQVSNSVASFWTIEGESAKDLRSSAAPAVIGENGEELAAESPLAAMFSVDGQFLMASTDFLDVIRSAYSVHHRTITFDARTGEAKEAAKTAEWAANAKAIPIKRKGQSYAVWGRAHEQVLTVTDSWSGDKINVELPRPETLPRDELYGDAYGFPGGGVADMIVSHDGTRVAARTQNSIIDVGGLDHNPDRVVVLRRGEKGGKVVEWCGGMMAFVGENGGKLWTLDPGSSPDHAKQWDLSAAAGQDPKQVPSKAPPLVYSVFALANGQFLANIEEKGWQRLNADLSVDGSIEYKNTPDTQGVCDEHCDVRVAASAERAFVRGNVVDLRSGEIKLTVEGQEGAISADGGRVAVFVDADYDAPTRSIKFWDVDTKKALPSITLSKSDTRTNRMLSPDGRAFLYTDDAQLFVHFADAAGVFSAKPIVFKDHPLKILDLAFSGDGKTLVSAQEDGILFVWNWADMQTSLGVLP